MKLPDKQNSKIIVQSPSALGYAGVALLILHVMGYLTGWAWPILYGWMILIDFSRHRQSEKD
jgi:hypothetical protein